MKLIVTGSLGHISHPLTITLVQQGHQVTVISSNPEKAKDIEALGATAAIGTLDDPDFLTATFTGADAVYCMIPPNLFSEPDRIAYCRRIAGNYAQAIRRSGVRRVVHLSTYGAHLDKGTGLILGSHYAENILGELPGITLTHMRPTYFYYNLLAFVNGIKTRGAIEANYGADKIIMVSPRDIAAAVAEELVTTHTPVRYVASEELSGNDVARILGKAIGKPDLKWIVIDDEQMLAGYEAAGFPHSIAEELLQIFVSLRTGALTEDFHRNKPATLGKVKLTDFAGEFATLYRG